MNLLLGFFLQDMDSWGTRVTHFSLHGCLIFMFQNLSKALNHDDCFIIISACPLNAQPLLLKTILGQTEDTQNFWGSNWAGWKENSQLPRQFWYFNSIFIKLRQYTQILYLIWFYLVIQRFCSCSHSISIFKNVIFRNILIYWGCQQNIAFLFGNIFIFWWKSTLLENV